MASAKSDRPRISRRSFLIGSGAGLATGAALAWLGYQALPGSRDRQSGFTGRSTEVRHPAFAMPGPFPGRVIEVHHPAAVNNRNEIHYPTVRNMMARGMCSLTGADDVRAAWRRFFERGDVVGIKVNPVGFSRSAHIVGSISSPAVLLEVVEGLKSAGVRAQDIIVFERYASEFREAGYETLMREPALDGVRWYASSADGGATQVDIEGYDSARSRRNRDPHVVGYDPDVFVHMGFAAPEHDPRDDRRFRSHLSVIVSRMVNKIVTIPCLKDHRSAGVTLALKNISHGFNNNVARSHLSNIYRWGSAVSGPNQCNTFIPTAAGQPLIRQKATLQILDGLIGVYEGGPGTWNRTWATWRANSLFFATDPVALDHVGWDIVDRKRAAEGWRPVARMGLLHHTPAMTLSGGLAALAAVSPVEAATFTAAADHLHRGNASEQFDRRQPEHIYLASTIGMGVFDARHIDHQRIVLRDNSV
jgi:uncharacterized protein (DUF362 family)